MHVDLQKEDIEVFASRLREIRIKIRRILSHVRCTQEDAGDGLVKLSGELALKRECFVLARETPEEGKKALERGFVLLLYGDVLQLLLDIEMLCHNSRDKLAKACADVIDNFFKELNKLTHTEQTERGKR